MIRNVLITIIEVFGTIVFLGTGLMASLVAYNLEYLPLKFTYIIFIVGCIVACLYLICILEGLKNG